MRQNFQRTNLARLTDDLTIVGFIVVEKESLDSNMDMDVDPLAGRPPSLSCGGQ